jgi:hypothetical protein
VPKLVLMRVSSTPEFDQPSRADYIDSLPESAPAAAVPKGQHLDNLVGVDPRFGSLRTEMP